MNTNTTRKINIEVVNTRKNLVPGSQSGPSNSEDMIKTFVIEPNTQTITERLYDGSKKAMREILGASQFKSVPYTRDCLVIDREGSHGDPFEQGYFLFDGKLVAGRAMTVGTDENGETAEATMTLADLEARITWIASDESCDAGESEE